MYELKYLLPHKGPLSKVLFEEGLLEFDCSNHNICWGGKGGGTNSTVTQNSAPPQYVQDAYTALLARGNQAADTSFQTPQQPVAGFTPDQTTAMDTIAGTQGSTNATANMGIAAANQGSQAIYPNLQQFNAQNLQQYMDPNTQNVINATMAQLNQNDAVQQSQLKGQAIASGASPFGGDRAGVAAAALAGQQDLANNQTIAGLNSQNYTQALNELNNQQQLQANTQSSDAYRQLTAASLYPQIGTTAQTNALNQASAQLQSGGLQQQLAQEQLNAPYQEQLAELAYPFETTQFLGGLTEGIGSGAGGSGTTTSPGPSTTSQLAGLGLTGLALNQALPAGYGLMSGLGSLFALKSGGRIPHRASGGIMPVPQVGSNNQVYYMGDQSLQNGGIALMARGGPAHYDMGGIAGVQLPNIPDVAVSVVPQAMTQHAGNGPPKAPEPYKDTSPSAAQSLLQGSSLGKIFGGSTATTPSSGINPSVTNLSNSSPIDLSTGNAQATQNLINSNFLDNPTSSPYGINYKSGGIASYDAGGMIISPQQAAMAQQSPMVQHQSQQYNSLPIDKLQQLAVMQPNNPLIQRTLQMKKMGAGAMGSNQGIAASGGMKKGGTAHYDDGGYVNDTPAEQVLQNIADSSQQSAGTLSTSPSSIQLPGIGASDIDASQIPPTNVNDLQPPSDAQGIAPPVNIKMADAQPMPPSEDENLDEKPVIDHSGDTIKVHYPSEKTSLDTGIPSMKDDTVASSAWTPLLAAGLGIMAGNSPHALENIGRGGLEGLQVAGSQREAALKENQAQVEAQKLADDLALRRQEMEQTGAYQKGELGLRKEQLEQGKYTIVPDQLGGFIKINNKTGETSTMQGSAGSMVPPIDAKTGQPLTGDAYLSTLSPENAAQVKAMDEGRLNFPAGFALKSPYWQQKLAQLYQYNPNASAQTAQAVKQFNVGPQGNQTRFLNVAVNHLDLLAQLTGALKNGDVKAINAVGNLWNSQTGSPAPTNFNTAKQIVGDEVTKAVIGAGGTGADRDKAQSVIDAANSPEQLKGAIQTYKALMTGQLSGLKQQYETSTGRKDYDKYLTEAAKKALLPVQQSSSAAISIPPLEQRVKGQSYTNSNGRTAIWTGTGWASQ